MSKETVTIIVNGVIAVGVIVLMALGVLPAFEGALVVLALAVPSAAPELIARLKDTLGPPKPTIRKLGGKGPPMLGVLLALAAGLHLATSLACTPPTAPTAGLPKYCFNDEAFARELERCPTKASTKAESRACRNEVHRACGVAEPPTAVSP